MDRTTPTTRCCICALYLFVIPVHRTSRITSLSLSACVRQVLDMYPLPGMVVSPSEGVVSSGGQAVLKIHFRPDSVIKFDTRVEVEKETRWYNNVCIYICVYVFKTKRKEGIDQSILCVCITDSYEEHEVHWAESGWISGASKCRHQSGEFVCVLTCLNALCFFCWRSVEPQQTVKPGKEEENKNITFFLLVMAVVVLEFPLAGFLILKEPILW